MPKKIEIKTQKTKASVSEFIASIEDETLRKDSLQLVQIFRKATGQKPSMWGPSIIGFGEHSYTRANGDFAPILAAGFSPRKSGPVLYVLSNDKTYKPILDKMGPHKTGKSCLYIKGLKDIDLKVLETLISKCYKDALKGQAGC